MCFPEKFWYEEKYYMKKITEDWSKSADADLAIIERILDQENLSHQVAFHAQQTVEKAFKR